MDAEYHHEDRIRVAETREKDTKFNTAKNYANGKKRMMVKHPCLPMGLMHACLIA